MQTSIFNIPDNYLCHLEAKGLSKCFASYAKDCAAEDILEIGFNPNSGYTYIALEFGVTIASMLGRDVVYIVVNYDTGEEEFFDDYDSASTAIFELTP